MPDKKRKVNSSDPDVVVTDTGMIPKDKTPRVDVHGNGVGTHFGHIKVPSTLDRYEDTDKYLKPLDLKGAKDLEIKFGKSRKLKWPTASGDMFIDFGADGHPGSDKNNDWDVDGEAITSVTITVDKVTKSKSNPSSFAIFFK